MTELPATKRLLRFMTYARYSTDQQRAASIQDQIRNCRRYSDAERWTIAAGYADQAMSGADSSRSQYQAMLAAAGRGEIDVLLWDDMSTLSRDQVESEQVIRRLEFHGVRIIAVSDGLVCDSCGANYVMGDAFKFACSSYTNGRACSNGVRVRRDNLEAAILGPIQTQLREPERVTEIPT